MRLRRHDHDEDNHHDHEDEDDQEEEEDNGPKTFLGPFLVCLTTLYIYIIHLTMF